MGGSLLNEKAKAFAKELGIEFSASEGWLTHFKKRNGIVFQKMYVESSSVDINAELAFGSNKGVRTTHIKIMFDPTPLVNPTPVAQADISRDALPRGGTAQYKLVPYQIPLKQEGMDDHRTL
ncbi:hypothetical protein TNCV_5011971 [Trichonephila clavipes]|nr:hypothetical protein TNCV_5011971 [Trichonephila clavipes]